MKLMNIFQVTCKHFYIESFAALIRSKHYKLKPIQFNSIGVSKFTKFVEINYSTEYIATTLKSRNRLPQHIHRSFTVTSSTT